MSRPNARTRRARAARSQQEQRDRIVAGRGGDHRDPDANGYVAACSASIVTGDAITVHTGNGRFARSFDDERAYREDARR